MKRFRPPFSQTRDGQVIVQTHEDERGRPPEVGNAAHAVAPGIAYLESNHAIAVDPDTRLDPILVAKIAVMEVLLGTTAYDVQFKAVLEGQRQRAQRIEVQAHGISFNWPESGVDAAPTKFTILGGEDFKFDGLGVSGPDMDTESADVYGAGQVLLHRHDVTGTVVIETICSTDSSRSALTRAFLDRFGTEPRDFRTGRRITLRCYYDRLIRMTLADIPFAYGADPTGERAKANEFPLSCSLTVEVPDVILVPHPGWFESIPRGKHP